MKISEIFKNELAGVFAGIFLFVLLISSGVTSLAFLIVNAIPVTLLLLTVYILVCNYIEVKGLRPVCHLANIINQFSENLSFWMLLSFLLAGSQLVLVWAGEAASFFYIGGLLPNGDANNYYKGARKILLEGEFSEWSSRRPFMTAYLAAVLLISKFSLSGSIVIITAFTAISAALFAASLRKTENLSIAFWAFVLVFFFYYRLLGSTLSENLGLVFGCISFVLLWSAANEKSIRWFALGVFFMSLAQVTRSGAVFVLPALIIWGTFWLCSEKNSRLKLLVSGGVAVAFGLLLNRFLLDLGGGDIQAGFSNFAYTLYGLSMGEGGWVRIKIDHPAIIALSEPARSREIYQLALTNIVQEPSKLIGALLRNLHLYTIANGGLNIVTGSKAWLLVQIPTLSGVIWCIRYIKTPRYALLLFVLAGVVISSTIITEDGGLRVFAATIPFSAAIAAVGLQFLVRQEGIRTHLNDDKTLLLSILLGVVLLLGVFLTILVAPLEAGAISSEKKSCDSGARSITISYPARTAIHLRKEGEEYSSYVPDIDGSNFRQSLKLNGPRRMWPDVNLLQTPYSLLSVGKYILLPTSLINNDPAVITICTEKKGWLYIDQRLLKNPS